MLEKTRSEVSKANPGSGLQVSSSDAPTKGQRGGLLAVHSVLQLLICMFATHSIIVHYKIYTHTPHTSCMDIPSMHPVAQVNRWPHRPPNLLFVLLVCQATTFFIGSVKPKRPCEPHHMTRQPLPWCWSVLLSLSSLFMAAKGQAVADMCCLDER